MWKREDSRGKKEYQKHSTCVILHVICASFQKVCYLYVPNCDNFKINNLKANAAVSFYTRMCDAMNIFVCVYICFPILIWNNIKVVLDVCHLLLPVTKTMWGLLCRNRWTFVIFFFCFLPDAIPPKWSCQPKWVPFSFLTGKKNSKERQYRIE